MLPPQTVDGSGNVEKCNNVKKTRQINRQAEKSPVNDCFVLFSRLCACSHTRACWMRQVILFLIKSVRMVLV